MQRALSEGSEKRSALSEGSEKRSAYWYHLTDQTNWGFQIRLQPRTPSVATDLECKPIETLQKRICVCPSVAQCLTAIPYFWFSKLFIYVTQRKINAIPAQNVCDAHITNEHWITRPCNFLQIEEIPERIMKLLPDSSPCGDPDQQSLKQQAQRLEQIRQILPPHYATFETISRKR